MAIVTNSELIELTGGLKQGAAQLRWIERNLGIKCPRKADGHPLITWERVNNPAGVRNEDIRKPNFNWTKPA